MNSDFVFVDELVSGIRWDAKYATWDNFTGKPVDGYLANRIVGTTGLVRSPGSAREERPHRLASACSCGMAIARNAPSIAFCAGRSSRRMAGRSCRHYPNINKAEMFERGICGREVGPQPGQHRRLDALSPG